MPNLRPLRVVLLRLAVVAAIFSLQRLLFWALNHGSFPAPPALAFIGGVRFDLSAIAWTYLPWLLAVLIAPAPRNAFRHVQKALFHISNVACFFLNCTDLEYFKFTLKRSTADLLGIANGGDDIRHLAPVFLRDYWYVVVIFLASIALAEWGYRRAGRGTEASDARPWWLWRLVLITSILLLSRGGMQYIPLGVLDAGKYAPPAYMPLVLNTPFTVMTSIGKPVLEEKRYMTEAEADRLWPVVHAYQDLRNTPPSILTAAQRPNVVVIILESFSAAYSGRLNGTGQGYMPFLDSLMGQGLCYTRAYANGRRSIDGIPAVVASMPKLMDEAFITSPYAQTPLTSLPSVLAAEGYRTSFFHGGHNGTMGFDGFAKSAGFQRYVGRDEYPDARDDDGVWGIRDVPFLHYFAQRMSAEREPFMSCLFTLSSHHPYRLPPADAERFKGGDLPIHPTLRYADDALRQFFRTAEQMPWYAHTLFVITADHTADLERAGEVSGSAYDHWIPLLYFMPEAIPPRTDDRVTQQIDILPTVLDLLGERKPFFAFGGSSLRDERAPAAVSENNATWLIVTDQVQLRTDGEQVLWADSTDTGGAASSTGRLGEAQQLARAAIQQFSAHLRRHELVVK
ncbi:MAG: sulfatase-like hydrolase/transferase [Flavobacteriales bacterium]